MLQRLHIGLLAIVCVLSSQPAKVTAAKLKRLVRPTYTDDALNAGYQGTVVYNASIDENGVPGDFELISPLGYGLQERALAALRQWRYEPTLLNGKPVKVFTQLEVTFKLSNVVIPLTDQSEERRRKQFNEALFQLKSPDQKTKAVTKLEELSRERYPPAQRMLGALHLNGDTVAKDEQRAAELITMAASQGFGRAEADLGALHLRGQGVIKDHKLGFTLLLKAARRGEGSAQYATALLYSEGLGVEKDSSEAAFWMCVASNSAHEAATKRKAAFLTKLTTEEQQALEKRASRFQPEP